MSAFVLVIALLLSVAYWRHVAALLAAGTIVLAVLGVVFLVQVMTAGSADLVR
jgi:hypothetical protein